MNRRPVMATAAGLHGGMRALCNEGRALAEHKLIDVRQKLADLVRIELTLTALVTQCRTTATGQVNCPLIASLQKAA